MIRARVLFAVVLLVAGCGSTAVKPGAPLSLRIVASADLNPEESGRASPLVLRIYAFDDAGEFLDADFAALFADDRAALPGGWRFRRELLLLPASEQMLSIDAQAGAGQLCAFAAYRDRRASRWRRCEPLAGGKTAVLQVQAATVEFH